MGLDMYLYARKHEYASKWYKSKGSKLKVEYPKDLTEIFPEFSEEANSDIPKDQCFRDRRAISRNTYYEIGYWRKANQIHNYFVEKCADGEDTCQEIYLDEEQLQELLDNCKYVLENKDRAEEMLPTQSGFFFGSTEYDEYYFQDLEHTVDIVEKALKLLKAQAEKGTYDYDIVYQASW